MQVISLDRYRNRDTRKLLNSLGIQADQNEVEDVLVAYRGADGSIRVAATGVFRDEAEAALTAAMELSAAYLERRPRQQLRGLPG